MEDKLLKTFSYLFNKHDNGGESLIFTVKFYHNGDSEGGIYTSQEVCLQSYFNSASINLYGLRITSDMLFGLAKELAQAEQEVKGLIKNEKQ